MIALIPILILGSIQIKQTIDVAEEYKDIQQQMNLRLADEIHAYVNNHKHVVEAIAGEITVSHHRKYSELTGVLKSLVKNFPGFINIYVADKTGKNLAFYSLNNQNELELNGYDFSKRNYYQEIATNHQTVISPLFQGQVTTDKPLIAIVVPVYDQNGNFDGYVSAALDLSEVKVLAEKYNYGNMAYAIVVDQHGGVIYHPDEQVRTVNCDLSKSPVLAKMYSQEKGNGVFNSTLNNREEFMTFTTLTDLKWLVIVSKPTSVYHAELFHSLQLTLALLLITMISCVVLSCIIANFLNYPIHLFVGYTKEISKQNFKLQPPKFTGWKMPSEMNVLADNFFKMAKSLHEKQNELIKLTVELEDRVEERTDNLQAVLDSMSDAIVIVDNRHTIIYANHRMEDLFALQVSWLLGKKEEDLINELNKRQKNSFFEVQRVFNNEKTKGLFTINLQEKTKDIAIFSFTVMSTKHASVLGRGYLFNDVTEKHAIDQLKNNLISLAAHEFKTPLTGIRGSVETLLRKDIAWEREFQQEMLEGVLEDALRIQILVDDWLDISKIDAKKLRLHKTCFSLKQLIEKVRKQFLRDEQFFSIELLVINENANVYADERRLEQVLVNIIHNAILYRKQFVHIKIMVNVINGKFYIKIMDDGIGIEEKHLPYLFERFYRIDLSTTRSRGGTGLGLAICKGIIEAHGGKIIVESQKNIGSTFTIVLPLKMPEEVENE